jgi:hypothetical protein
MQKTEKKCDACRPGYCRFTAHIDERVANSIRAEARHRGVFISDLVNAILDQWLKKNGTIGKNS